MTEVRKYMILKKKIRCLFIIMKKMDILNQSKIIKFIEKHTLFMKKFINYWRNSHVYKKRNKYPTATLERKKLEKSNTEDTCIKSISNIPLLSNSESQFEDEINVSSVDFESKNSIATQLKLEIESYERNYNTVSEGDDITQNECEEISESDNTLTKTTTKKYVCFICKKSFLVHDSLISHIFKHDGTPQSCFKCKTVFENATFFKFHLSKDNSESCFSCEEDNYKLISLDQLLFCPYCGKKYSTSFNLRRHVCRCDFFVNTTDSSESIFTCDLCSWQGYSKDDYGKHYMKHAKHHCVRCNISFSSRKLLREHNTNHEKIIDGKYYCEVCSLAFSTRSLYREHMKVYKNDPKHIKVKLSDKSINKIWCKPCQKSFIDEKSYKRHCSRQNHLKINKQEILHLKSFICDKCGLVLKSKEGLTDHLISMHKPEGKMICDFCPYTTNKISNMRRHKKVRHINAPKEHACDKCPVLFSSLSGLQTHMKSVHSTDRPYLCSFCNKGFKLQSQLNRHTLIHNPILQYPCTYCTMGFRRHSYLKRHIASKHDEFLQNNMNPSEFKMNKKAKTLQQNMAAPQMLTLQDDQMLSLLDVQSGELVLLSMKDISKNNVINMSAEDDLLNGVHMPDSWTNSGNGLYCMDPMLEDNRNPQTDFMLDPNAGNPQTVVEVQPEYVYFPQPNKEMEMLANSYGNVKENVLPQNTMNPELIATDPSCNNLNFCTIVLE